MLFLWISKCTCLKLRKALTIFGLSAQAGLVMLPVRLLLLNKSEITNRTVQVEQIHAIKEMFILRQTGIAFLISNKLSTEKYKLLLNKTKKTPLACCVTNQKNIEV